MKIKEGRSLAGLNILMRPVLRVAEQLWVAHGRAEGVTITCATSGEHSATSWHYYGLALDMRTWYFDEATQKLIVNTLKEKLPAYDVIHHKTHIHVEIGNRLANQHKLLT